MPGDRLREPARCDLCLVEFHCGVHHYSVYLSVDGGPFGLQKAVAVSRCRIRLTAGGVHRIRVVAHNDLGVSSAMSDPSEEVVYIDGVPEEDTDHDGLPDEWEILYGLDPSGTMRTRTRIATVCPIWPNTWPAPTPGKPRRIFPAAACPRVPGSQGAPGPAAAGTPDGTLL